MQPNILEEIPQDALDFFSICTQGQKNNAACNCYHFLVD
jgi:hypothetical protein